MIPIPRMPREQALPLKRVIEATANDLGMSEHDVFCTLSRLLEGIADEVTKGREVRIPGFGMFAPVAVDLSRSNYKIPRCVPRFAPTRSFRQQVMFGAPPNESGKKAMKLYNKHHVTSPANDDGARVFSAQARMRRDVLAQIAG